MILMILIVFAIVFYIGIKVYQHDNSDFIKQTGYSIKDSMVNSKVSMLKKLTDATTKEHKLLYNVKVEDVNDTYIADAVLIHSSGIHLIQFQRKTGWITGSEKSYEWIEQHYRDKSSTFPNPIHKSLRMIFALTDLHEELEKDMLQATLVFSNECSFQHVEVESSNVEVLKSNEVPKWVRELSGKKLTKEQIESAYQLLKQYANS